MNQSLNFYDVRTDERLIAVLELARTHRKRISLTYQDGQVKRGLIRLSRAGYPILVKQTRSTKGAMLYERQIVKVENVWKTVLWACPEPTGGEREPE